MRLCEKLSQKTLIIQKTILFHKKLKKKHIFAATLRGRAVVARRAHNPEAVGSSPAPATKGNANSFIIKLVAFFGFCFWHVFGILIQ